MPFIPTLLNDSFMKFLGYLFKSFICPGRIRTGAGFRSSPYFRRKLPNLKIRCFLKGYGCLELGRARDAGLEFFIIKIYPSTLQNSLTNQNLFHTIAFSIPCLLVVECAAFSGFHATGDARGIRRRQLSVALSAFQR